jgi:hypothetical protein
VVVAPPDVVPGVDRICPTLASDGICHPFLSAAETRPTQRALRSVVLPNLVTPLRHRNSLENFCLCLLPPPRPDVPREAQSRRSGVNPLEFLHRKAVLRSESSLPHHILANPDKEPSIPPPLCNPSLLRFGDRPQLSENLFDQFLILIPSILLSH